jgi:hypothetical protein
MIETSKTVCDFDDKNYERRTERRKQSQIVVMQYST